MRRYITLITLSLWAAAAAPAQTAGQVTALKASMAAAAQDDWALAGLSAVAGGALVREFTAWQRLRDGQGEFDDYRAFLTRSGDWPGLVRLRREGEPTLRGMAPQLVLDYFDGRVPETGAGIMALIEAHAALGNDGDAQALIVLAWRTHPLDAEAEAELLERYPAILGAHHTARLDEMLWQFESAAARRMFPLVSEDWQKLAEARLALRARASGVDDLIKAIPAELQTNAGLVFERFNWRARKGLNDRAIDLLAEQSVSGEALGQPSRWANWRRIYARMRLREGAVEQAYLLASTHFLTEGSSYADLEWLSGFIALRFLDDPELALFHFQNFRAAVATPISLGRAGYWQGRAYAAAGNTEEAEKAYEFGAQYQTSFYGLLATEEAGLSLDPALAGKESFPAWDSLPQSQGRVFQMGKLLLDAGELNFAEWFLTHLTESLTREEAGSLGAWAITQGEPHLALMIAKRAARRGITLPAAYYPLHPLAEEIWPVPTELALSIARRESEFDPVVVSPAGALGLMQLMPGTAKQVAGELGVDFTQSRLTSDPAYNAQLGTSYLEDLTEIFGTSPILISVGYNAGPSRAVRWSENRGDPRANGVDLIDWIELIPFRETRKYVMRVTESLPVYRARLSGKTEPLEFLKELRSGY